MERDLYVTDAEVIRRLGVPVRGVFTVNHSH